MKEGQLRRFCLWDGTCLKAMCEKGEKCGRKRAEKQRPLSEMSFKDLPCYSIAQQLTLSIFLIQLNSFFFFFSNKEVITFMSITIFFCLVILGLTSVHHYCFLWWSGLKEAVLRENTLQCSIHFRKVQQQVDLTGMWLITSEIDWCIESISLFCQLLHANNPPLKILILHDRVFLFFFHGTS